MTRDELIEAIAAKRWCPDHPQPCPHWQALTKRDKQECMDEVRVFWPVIVDLVAAWIGNFGLSDNDAGSMAALWREEMA